MLTSCLPSCWTDNDEEGVTLTEVILLPGYPHLWRKAVQLLLLRFISSNRRGTARTAVQVLLLAPR